MKKGFFIKKIFIIFSNQKFIIVIIFYLTAFLFRSLSAVSLLHLPSVYIMRTLHVIFNTDMQNLHILFLEKSNLYNEARIFPYRPFLRFLAHKPASKAKTGSQTIFAEDM